MIERDLERVAGSSFDLVIVGGGVYGVALTLEAARRGLAPLLVERGDFGGQTSWNTLRILHGGLRYLQRCDVRRFREMVRERQWWCRHFPELVQPLPFLMPLFGRGLRRPAVLKLALVANSWLSRRGNWDSNLDRELVRSSVLGPAETIALCPHLEREGLRGGALWYDGLMADSHRLVIEMLHWVADGGAVALNYVEAKTLVVDGGKVSGLELRDVESDRMLEVGAPTVVNCAGPWSLEVAAAFDCEVPDLFRPSLAFNLLFDREPPAEVAVAVSPQGGQRGSTHFLVPWKNRLLAGTFHSPWQRSLDEGAVDGGLIEDAIERLNLAIPSLELQPDEVLRVLWGFLPARRLSSDKLATRDTIRHHAESGGPQGFFSVSGIKFTTARAVAERTLRKIQRWRGETLAESARARPPVIRRPVCWREFEQLLESDGDRAREYLRKLIANEAVRCLEDLMLRRTDWGLNPKTSASRGAVVAALVE